MTTSGFSVTIPGDLSTTDDDIYVGNVDTFLTWAEMQGNSSPATETAWVNDYLSITYGITVNYTVRDEENLPIFSTDVAGVYAVEIPATDPPTDTDYFLVKNATYVALYANLEDFAWGVFSAADLPIAMNIPGGYTVSHVTRFDDPNGGGGGGGEVPEPATMMLRITSYNVCYTKLLRQLRPTTVNL